MAVPRSLVVLLLASMALLVSWSFAVPIFEAPDEPDHWQYARYLNRNHTLPVYSPSFVEANSPPLYYVVIAPLAVRTDQPPRCYTQERGLFSLRFPPRLFQNANGDFGRYWPIRGARLATALMSVVTVLFCWLAGMEASTDPMTGLLVGGLVAFWPQFTFRGMNVSNDALVTMFSSVAVYLMVRLVRRGFTWSVGVLAALAVSAAFLSKANALFLPVPLMASIFSERADCRSRFIRAAVLSTTMLLVVAPWLIRNRFLYGDVLAQKAMLTAVSQYVHIKPLVSRYFVTEFPLLLTISSIGDFGWMNVPLPLWAYFFYAGLLVYAVQCCARAVVQHRIDLRLCLLLLSIFVLNLVVVIYINLTFTQPQGRYMFPAVPAIALLLGLGLQAVRGWSRKSTLAILLALALSNVLILGGVVIPAYWPPVLE